MCSQLICIKFFRASKLVSSDPTDSKLDFEFGVKISERLRVLLFLRSRCLRELIILSWCERHTQGPEFLTGRKFRLVQCRSELVRGARLIRAWWVSQRAERTKHDFRCSYCRSAIGPASCLICVRRRHLTFPSCC